MRWTFIVVRRVRRLAFAPGAGPSLATALLIVAPLGAQARPTHGSCRIACAPAVTLMPGVLRTHLFGGPTVRATSGGVTHRLPGASNLELVVAVSAETALPRVSLFGSVQWLPNASEARNPFTLYAAQELGSRVHANAPTLTLGASTMLLPARATRGLGDLALTVGDLFSQAARPAARRAYTHKLDLGLVGHVHAFAWTPASTYLHRVTTFGILDYVATGLPRAGDEVPKGRVFVSHARPAALLVGLALPLTPAVP